METAAEFFDQIPAKASRARDLRAMIAAAGAVGGSRPDAIHASGGGACDRVLGEIEATERRRAKLAAIEAELDEARAIIEGVRAGLGDKHAEAMTQRYLKPPRTSRAATSYRIVAARLGVTPRVARYRVLTALAWLDSNGPRRVADLAAGLDVALVTAAA